MAAIVVGKVIRPDERLFTALKEATTMTADRKATEQNQEPLESALEFQLAAINDMLIEYSSNEKFLALPLLHARLCNMRDDIEAVLSQKDEGDYDAWNNEQNRKHYEMVDANQTY